MVYTYFISNKLINLILRDTIINKNSMLFFYVNFKNCNTNIHQDEFITNNLLPIIEAK